MITDSLKKKKKIVIIIICLYTFNEFNETFL